MTIPWNKDKEKPARRPVFTMKRFLNVEDLEKRKPTSGNPFI
jgi:hypothetical protein